MRVGSIRPGLAIVLGLVATVIVLLSERGVSQIPYSPAEAHRYADSVLAPKFTACFNEWALAHPTEEEHFQKLDAGDAKRLKAAIGAFREMSRAYERAGY